MVSIQNTIMERDDLPALVEACHAEALKMDETHDTSYRSVSREAALRDWAATRKVVQWRQHTPKRLN
jgi:Fe-S-cluster-containing hydrogenase component 2